MTAAVDSAASLADAHRTQEPTAPRLQLDGFEGPLDLLLELARAQKVDLARISILQLVEQYLAVVEAERKVRLELAADWLVMAAWLAWLKSRLLLPAEEGAPEEGELAAEFLAARLAELAHVGRAAAWLGARDQLGHQVFARGEPEPLREIDRSGYVLELPHLLGAYMGAMRRMAKKRVYRPKPLAFWTVQDALSRLRLLLGGDMPGWCSLTEFLPEWLEVFGAGGPGSAFAAGEPGSAFAAGGPGSAFAAGEPARVQAMRAALAGTLIAGLELVRSGIIEMRQESAFGSIMLRRSENASLQEAAE